MKMKNADILLALEEIAANIGIELRYEKGDFEGGLCRVDQEQLIIINTNLLTQRKITLLARELSTVNLDDVFIVPAIRNIIETERNKLNEEIKTQDRKEREHE